MTPTTNKQYPLTMIINSVHKPYNHVDYQSMYWFFCEYRLFTLGHWFLYLHKLLFTLFHIYFFYWVYYYVCYISVLYLITILIDLHLNKLLEIFEIVRIVKSDYIICNRFFLTMEGVLVRLEHGPLKPQKHKLKSYMHNLYDL